MSGQDSFIRDTIRAVLSGPLPVSSENLSSDGMLILLPKLQSIHPTWFFIYLMILLGFFAWIRLYYGNTLTQTIQAATNFQFATRMFNDNSLLQRQLDNILYGLYFFTVSFLVFFLEIKFGQAPYGLNGGLLYLFNLALLTGLFFGRIVLMNLVGFLFDRLKIFQEYLYNTFIFNKLMGMMILPLLFFTVYTKGVLHEVIFWLTVGSVALVLSMRLFRGFVFSFKKDVSIIYMFLYLCALEIVPLTLLYRWLKGIL